MYVTSCFSNLKSLFQTNLKLRSIRKIHYFDLKIYKRLLEKVTNHSNFFDRTVWIKGYYYFGSFHKVETDSQVGIFYYFDSRDFRFFHCQILRVAKMQNLSVCFIVYYLSCINWSVYTWGQFAFQTIIGSFILFTIIMVCKR